MRVQELINYLNEVEDKTKTVYAYIGSEHIDIEEIDYVDELDDRVDLNTLRDY